MIHLILLLKRREDEDRLEFLRYWRDVHAPLAASRPGVRRYVQNTVSTVPGTTSPYDCVDEIWVDDVAAADGLLRSVNDGSAGKLIDVRHSVSLQTTDHVMHAGAQIGKDESLPKRMTFFKRKQGLSREDMLHYWRSKHGPLAASVPRLRRYVQSAMLQTAYMPGEPRFDGVAQIWLEDDAALQAVVSSKLFRESVKPDEANFVALDTVITLSMDEERRVVWPEPA
ncbi:EthD domain-containing protein [Cupriavidus sp. CP313]